MALTKKHKYQVEHSRLTVEWKLSDRVVDGNDNLARFALDQGSVSTDTVG